MFLPQNTQRQKVTALDVDVEGCEKFSQTYDSFGNKKLYGRIIQPHSHFSVKIKGTVQTGVDIFEEYTDYPLSAVMFKTQTQLTGLGDKLDEYHKSLMLDKLDGDYEKALRIMRSLPDVFAYDKGVTEIHETAENAFSLGRGVCQDYAHIMISLLRAEHIPARYIVGMMTGEGASHAWVEALCKGYWYGFDPTNNRLVDDGYIRVSCGRDSGDCSVIRGSFYGCAKQSQSETVTVEEIKQTED